MASDQTKAFLPNEYITQENGQRRFGGPPPGWVGEPPSGRGTEIFIGKLPRRIDEQQLWALFNECGVVYEMRIMIDFSGENRGFCFIIYATKEDAKRAVAYLNNREVQPGRRIGCVPSVDNRRLFVGGLPRDRSIDDVRKELSELVPGVVDVILYPSATDKSKNRGFAFVEFENHRLAALARQKLTREHAVAWGQALCVDWAEPEQDVDDETMSQVRILYVRNLLLSTTETALRDAFEASVPPGSVEKVKKIKDFAFVHFKCRQSAAEALSKMHNSMLDGARLEVVWAKPPDRTIMKFVRSSLKSGQAPAMQQGITPTVNNPYIQPQLTNPYALVAQQYAGTTLTPPHSAGLTGAEWAYAGSPLIDTTHLQHINLALGSPPFVSPTSGASFFGAPPGGAHEHAPHDRILSRLARGAAGTRGVGFQTYVNNQMRRTRRRYTDDLHTYPLLGQQTALPTYMPTMYPQPMIDPNLYAAYMATQPTVEQIMHASTMSGIDPSVLLTPGGVFNGVTGAHNANADVNMSVSTSPTQANNTNAVEMLSAYCAARQLGEPIYELRVMSAPSVNLQQAEQHDAVVYLYKVTVPKLVGVHFTADHPSATEAEAKQYAAVFTLVRLGETLGKIPMAPQSSSASVLPELHLPAHAGAHFTQAQQQQPYVFMPHGLVGGQ